jgi:hypothetical protein
MMRIKTKLNQIIERKMTLDNEYFKRLEQNDQRKLILQMLKQVKVTELMNRDGILDQYLDDFSNFRLKKKRTFQNISCS